MIDQAVILCAGSGTRLRPLTDKIPKPMVTIGGRPLLEHLISGLKEHGVREVFINLHHLPEKITDYFSDGRKWNMKITYAYESEILGTAGGIKQFEPHLAHSFLVVYGDMWNRLDFRRFHRFYQQQNNPAGAVVVAKADRRDVDLVDLDENHRFKSFYHRPHPEGLVLENKLFLNAIYLFSKRVLDLVPPGSYCELDREILPKLLRSNWPLYGYQTDEPVLDIGTFDRLDRIRRFYSG